MKTEKNYVLVDVRSEDEYNSGHIPNAICIPNESIKEEVKAFSQDKMRTFNLSVSASFDLLYLNLH